MLSLVRCLCSLVTFCRFGESVGLFYCGAPAGEGPPSGAPYSSCRGKKKETHELIFSWLSWLAVLLVGAYARRRRDDDDGGVAEHGGHTPKSLSLPRTSLKLDIPAMINWHLSKQAIRWPVPRDHIAGSSLQLIEVTRFYEVDRWPSVGFPIGSRAHARLTCWKQGKIVLGRIKD